jgi:RES domain-containing protein
MTEEQFRSGIHDFLQKKNADIVTQIPEGSGICHIATVSADKWITGFVNKEPGRWNKAGTPMKYYGDAFKTCAAEKFGTDTNKLDECVFEHWQMTKSVISFDISKFPEPLRTAFFEDKGNPPEKWRKPHILIEEAQASPYFSGVHSVYAPSASGQELGIGGMVFATNDPYGVAKLLNTGNYQNWLNE